MNYSYPNNFQNGYNAPQAPLGVAPAPQAGFDYQAPLGYAPVPNSQQPMPQGYPLQSGNAPQTGSQPRQSGLVPNPGYAPQQPASVPQAGYSSPQQAQSAGQERVNYTQMISNRPENGLQDLTMTVVLGIQSVKNMYFEKYLSRNGNPCVGIKADLVLGDKFVSDTFGPQLVNADHSVPFSFSLAGFDAKNFLERTPNSTKSIVVMLNGFSVSDFTYRDGRQGHEVRCSSCGYAVIHNSTRFKMGELLKAVQNPDQFLSKPFSVFDKNANGASGQAGNSGYQQAPAQATIPHATQLPGVSRFEEMDDEELPF